MMMPTTPMNSIVTTKMSNSVPPSSTGSLIAPRCERGTVKSHMLTKEATMNTSPWAKLISSMIP